MGMGRTVFQFYKEKNPNEMRCEWKSNQEIEQKAAT